MQHAALCVAFTRCVCSSEAIILDGAIRRDSVVCVLAEQELIVDNKGIVELFGN